METILTPGVESIYKALVSGLEGTKLAQAYFAIGLAQPHKRK